MKVLTILLSVLILQTSASFFDEFRGAVTTVESSFGKLLNDVIYDVKETIDCTLLAVEQVLSLGMFGDQSAYDSRCKDAQVEQPTAALEPEPASSEQEMFTLAPIPVLTSIESRQVGSSILNVDEVLCDVLKKDDAHAQLETVKLALQNETERLTQISDLLRRQLEELSNEVKEKFKSIELQTSEPSVESIWNNIIILHQIEHRHKNTPEARKISHILDQILDILDANEEDRTDEDDYKIKEIMRKLSKQSNDGSGKLWKDADDYPKDFREYANKIFAESQGSSSPESSSEKPVTITSEKEKSEGHEKEVKPDGVENNEKPDKKKDEEKPKLSKQSNDGSGKLWKNADDYPKDFREYANKIFAESQGSSSPESSSEKPVTITSEKEKSEGHEKKVKPHGVENNEKPDKNKDEEKPKLSKQSNDGSGKLWKDADDYPKDFREYANKIFAESQGSSSPESSSEKPVTITSEKEKSEGREKKVKPDGFENNEKPDKKKDEEKPKLSKQSKDGSGKLWKDADDYPKDFREYANKIFAESQGSSSPENSSEKPVTITSEKEKSEGHEKKVKPDGVENNEKPDKKKDEEKPKLSKQSKDGSGKLWKDADDYTKDFREYAYNIFAESQGSCSLENSSEKPDTITSEKDKSEGHEKEVKSDGVENNEKPDKKKDEEKPKTDNEEEKPKEITTVKPKQKKRKRITSTTTERPLTIEELAAQYGSLFDVMPDDSFDKTAESAKNMFEETRVNEMVMKSLDEFESNKDSQDICLDDPDLLDMKK